MREVVAQMTDQPALPTLIDVATAAGVSTATVSRVINDPDKVSSDTRRRVQTAISRLGYSPHFGARMLAARRSKTIGAIIPTMENAVFARGLQAFQDRLRQHGYTMLVASTAYDAATEEEQIRALVARGADALLLIGHSRQQALYEFLAAQRVPALVTWSVDQSSSQAAVGFDNKAAMYEMAAEVIGMGHQRLALISAQTASNDRARERHHGVLAAMEAHRLPPEQLQFIETSYGIEEGATALGQLMQAPEPPTAVFCGNDVLAVGALRRARALGIDVPGDLSIIGFDDIELAQVVHPALTTVHVPHREMGRLAATALIALLEQGKPLETVTLKANPVHRGTLAKPK